MTTLTEIGRWSPAASTSEQRRYGFSEHGFTDRSWVPNWRPGLLEASLQETAAAVLSEYVAQLSCGHDLAFSEESRELAHRVLASRQDRGASDTDFVERLAAEAAEIRE